MRTITASRFKAQCLGLMDEVEANRETVLVTKNGKPVAQLGPVPFAGEDPIFGFYRGKIEILGDIVSPTQTDAETESYLSHEAANLL
jgi:prevent-host-death family protein